MDMDIDMRSRTGMRKRMGGGIGKGLVNEIIGSKRPDSPLITNNMPDQMNRQITGGAVNKVSMAAVVDSNKCTGCGICENYCPTNAISIDTVAMIDESKCTGCGQCFNECSQGAITLIGT